MVVTTFSDRPCVSTGRRTGLSEFCLRHGAFKSRQLKVWRPLDLSPARHSTAEVIGILAQGVTASEADDSIANAVSSLALVRDWSNPVRTAPMTAEPLQRRHNRKFAVSLYALLAGAVLLHLIASTYIASLFLARVTSRQRQWRWKPRLGPHRPIWCWPCSARSAWSVP